MIWREPPNRAGLAMSVVRVPEAAFGGPSGQLCFDHLSGLGVHVWFSRNAAQTTLERFGIRVILTG